MGTSSSRVTPDDSLDRVSALHLFQAEAQQRNEKMLNEINNKTTALMAAIQTQQQMSQQIESLQSSMAEERAALSRLSEAALARQSEEHQQELARLTENIDTMKEQLAISKSYVSELKSEARKAARVAESREAELRGQNEAIRAAINENREKNEKIMTARKEADKETASVGTQTEDASAESTLPSPAHRLSIVALNKAAVALQQSRNSISAPTGQSAMNGDKRSSMEWKRQGSPGPVFPMKFDGLARSPSTESTGSNSPSADRRPRQSISEQRNQQSPLLYSPIARMSVSSPANAPSTFPSLAPSAAAPGPGESNNWNYPIKPMAVQPTHINAM